MKFSENEFIQMFNSRVACGTTFMFNFKSRNLTVTCTYPFTKFNLNIPFNIECGQAVFDSQDLRYLLKSAEEYVLLCTVQNDDFIDHDGYKRLGCIKKMSLDK